MSKKNLIFSTILLLAILSVSYLSLSSSNYPVNLSEDSVNLSDRKLRNPHVSTNGDFKIYWEANGTALTDAQDMNPNNDYYDVISDGQGGAIIVWTESDGGNINIYAQKINSIGSLLWGQSGTVICNDTTEQKMVVLCTDGAGGAIVAWTDKRDAVQYDIYAQRINATGKTQWGNEKSWGGNPDRNGTVICNATRGQYNTQICSDKANGAIITWQDERIATDQDDIYAQRISSDGTTHWGNEKSWGGMADRNGTVICNATNEQTEQRMCADGAGGAIITWVDERIAEDIYAQRVDFDGTTHWGDGTLWGVTDDLNGTLICNATNYQRYPSICTDNANGAIIVWEDGRNGNSDLYAQQVSSDGTTHWGDEKSWGGKDDLNGTVIVNATDTQEYHHVCADGAGGAIIVWEDYRNPSTSTDIYAQRVNSDGNTHWGDGKSWGIKDDRNGTLICNDNSWQCYSSLCSDGVGGAIIIWEDGRNGVDADVYAQRVSSDGTTHWGDGTLWGVTPDRNGTAICNKEKNQRLSENYRIPSLCSDENNGAFIAWWNQTGAGFTMAAQQVRGAILPKGGGLPAGDDDDDDDDEEAAIPFGNHYLLFAAIAIASLVIITKRKAVFSKK